MFAFLSFSREIMSTAMIEREMAVSVATRLVAVGEEYQELLAWIFMFLILRGIWATIGDLYRLAKSFKRPPNVVWAASRSPALRPRQVEETPEVDNRHFRRLIQECIFQAPYAHHRTRTVNRWQVAIRKLRWIWKIRRMGHVLMKESGRYTNIPKRRDPLGTNHFRVSPSYATMVQTRAREARERAEASLGVHYDNPRDTYRRSARELANALLAENPARFPNATNREEMYRRAAIELARANPEGYGSAAERILRQFEQAEI